DGAPALPEVTKQVEQFIGEIPDAGGRSNVAADADRIEAYDPRPAYMNDLAQKIRFDVIARADGRYAYDPLWGTGRGYLDQVLRDHGLEVETIHDWRDVLFGGRAPEPDDHHLDELRAAMKRRNCVLGLATDGDSD